MSESCSGNCGSCASGCNSDEKLKNRLSVIKNKLLVLSGKGGVGKSTVAASLALGAGLVEHTVEGEEGEANPVAQLAATLRGRGLVRALVKESNPIPVKWAMNRLGWKAGGVRLPLVDASPVVQQMLETELKKNGLL